MTNENGTTMSVEEVIQQAVASGKMLAAIDAVAEISDDSPPLLETLEAVNELDCLPGYEAVDGTECGTYICTTERTPEAFISTPVLLMSWFICL